MNIFDGAGPTPVIYQSFPARPGRARTVPDMIEDVFLGPTQNQRLLPRVDGRQIPFDPIEYVRIKNISPRLVVIE